MDSKKELQIAYILTGILFVVGVLSYAVCPAKTTEQPIRMMFTGVAGNVLFDHQTHTDESGYGLTCLDCHHHPAEDENVRACNECHPKKEIKEAPGACLDCHEEDEIEVESIKLKTDAFHLQCIECHREFGAGPVECSACHVM